MNYGLGIVQLGAGSGTTMECSIGCEVAKCGSLALCLHYGPRFGPCTVSLDGAALTRLITLSQSSGLSTPGLALLPHGFGMCQVSLPSPYSSVPGLKGSMP